MNQTNFEQQQHSQRNQTTLRCTRSPSGVPKNFHLYQTALNCSRFPIDEPDHTPPSKSKLTTSWKDLSIERGTEEWENAQEEFKLQNRKTRSVVGICDNWLRHSEELQCITPPSPPQQECRGPLWKTFTAKVRESLVQSKYKSLGGGSIHRQPNYEYYRLTTQ